MLPFEQIKCLLTNIFIYFLFIVWPINIKNLIIWIVKVKFINRFKLQDNSLFLYPLLCNISLTQPRKIIESTARTRLLLLLLLPFELNNQLLLKLVPAFCKLKFALLPSLLTQRKDNHREYKTNITLRPITVPLDVNFIRF